MAIHQSERARHCSHCQDIVRRFGSLDDARFEDEDDPDDDDLDEDEDYDFDEDDEELAE